MRQTYLIIFYKIGRKVKQSYHLIARSVNTPVYINAVAAVIRGYPAKAVISALEFGQTLFLFI